MHGTKLEFYCDLLRDVAKLVMYAAGAVGSVGVAAFIIKHI